MQKINELQKLYMQASGVQLSGKKQLMPEPLREQPLKVSSNTADF